MKKSLNWIPVIVMGAAIVVLVFLNIQERKRSAEITAQLMERIDELTRLISEKDTTISYYSGLVNNFDIKEKDLQKQIKEINSEYARILKDKDERLLAVHEYSLLLESQVDSIEGKLTQVSESVFSLDIKDFYPNLDKWFIKYDAVAQIDLKDIKKDPVIAREFSFSPVNINMVMTETDKGAWRYNILDAPDWIKIGKIQVNSLAPQEYKPPTERGLLWSVGGGIMSVYGDRAYLTLSAGAEYKGWQGIASAGIGAAQITVMKRLKK